MQNLNLKSSITSNISKIPALEEFPDEIEMTMVGHLEELRKRLLRSLLIFLLASISCLDLVRPLVKVLEKPAGNVRFLQLAPGEFLFVSLKVAGYAGLVLVLPYLLFEGLAFMLPGLTRRERKLVAPSIAASVILFLGGLIFAWSTLIPAALQFLISYGADVVEPIWSIERYLDFVLVLMLSTAIAFQLPILQVLLRILGIINFQMMVNAWRWVILSAALAGAILTPSTDPITMIILASAIIMLFCIGLILIALVDRFNKIK